MLFGALVRSRAFAGRFGEAQRYAQEWAQGSSEPGGHATRASEPRSQSVRSRAREGSIRRFDDMSWFAEGSDRAQ
jgi:hypothetical protein